MVKFFSWLSPSITFPSTSIASSRFEEEVENIFRVIIWVLIIKNNINAASAISQYKGLRKTQPKKKLKIISAGNRHPLPLKNTKDLRGLFISKQHQNRRMRHNNIFLLLELYLNAGIS